MISFKQGEENEIYMYAQNSSAEKLCQFMRALNFLSIPSISIKTLSPSVCVYVCVRACFIHKNIEI
jgi:hypothetical protein